MSSPHVLIIDRTTPPEEVSLKIKSFMDKNISLGYTELRLKVIQRVTPNGVVFCQSIFQAIDPSSSPEDSSSSSSTEEKKTNGINMEFQGFQHLSSILQGEPISLQPNNETEEVHRYNSIINQLHDQPGRPFQQMTEPKSADDRV